MAERNFFDLPDDLQDKIAIEPTSGCWLWLAGRRGRDQAYGSVRVCGRTENAHRVVYEYLRGLIPEGLTLDHCQCQTKSCVNPWHLEAVTTGENNRRAAKLRPPKTHCQNGHPWNSENTHVGIGSNGTLRRFCRPCRRDWSRQFRAEKQ